MGAGITGVAAAHFLSKSGIKNILLVDERPPLSLTSHLSTRSYKNNLVKGEVRPELHLAGTGEAPELTGRIYVDPSTLYLPAGRMQFDSGVIHIEATDPGRPRLDMVGTARMIGYDITARGGRALR